MSNLPVSLGTVADVIPGNIVVPPVDYTSRDYASILNDLVTLIPSYLPEWTDRSPGDFGIVLLELFAYMGDILNYYSDRIANEAFISTAQQRQSVLNIAALLDYTPHNNVSASTTLNFTIGSPSGPVSIPAGTQVATTLTGNQPVVFETAVNLWLYGDLVTTQLPPATTAMSAWITSNGAANQQIVIGNVGLTAGSYPTYVYNGSTYNQQICVTPPGQTVGGTPTNPPTLNPPGTAGSSDVLWALAPGNTFVNTQPGDHYYTVVPASGDPRLGSIIKFGNNINGMIPPTGSAITIVYHPHTPNHYTDVVPAIQGQSTLGEGIGISDGTPNQLYTLFQTPVVDGSVTVYVDEGAGALPWTYHQRIVDAFANENAFTLSTDANGVVTVGFGDNIAGKIPPPGAFITADYRVGGGAIGNVAPGSLINLQSGPAAIQAVTNPGPAVGGADAESIDHIRIHAPLSISAINRAVTLDDYAALVLNIPQIAKASTMSTAYNAVNIYIHPTGDFMMTGPNDTTGQTTLTTRVNALLPSITNVGMTGYMDDKKMVGTTINILPPQWNKNGVLITGYVPADITCQVQVLPMYHQSTVQAACVAAIYNLFLFSVVDFGHRVSLSSLYHSLMNVEGVDYVVSATMYRDEAPGNPGDIVCASYEIPMANSVNVSCTGGVVY